MKENRQGEERGERLEILPYSLTVARLNSLEGLDLTKEFFFLGKTDEEISLVCKTQDTPQHPLEREDGWRGFRIQGTLDFSLIGILSRITGVLARREISVFAVSTYRTDYILIKEENFERALSLLCQEGYEVL